MSFPIDLRHVYAQLLCFVNTVAMAVSSRYVFFSQLLTEKEKQGENVTIIITVQPAWRKVNYQITLCVDTVQIAGFSDETRF